MSLSPWLALPALLLTWLSCRQAVVAFRRRNSLLPPRTEDLLEERLRGLEGPPDCY
jgi:hypothetical protein